MRKYKGICSNPNNMSMPDIAIQNAITANNPTFLAAAAQMLDQLSYGDMEAAKKFRGYLEDENILNSRPDESEYLNFSREAFGDVRLLETAIEVFNNLNIPASEKWRLLCALYKNR